MVRVRKPLIPPYLEDLEKEEKEIEKDEEKPLVENLTNSSEDYHGGEELTESMDDQRDEEENGEEEKEESEEEESDQQPNSSSSCKNSSSSQNSSSDSKSSSSSSGNSDNSSSEAKGSKDSTNEKSGESDSNSNDNDSDSNNESSEEEESNSSSDNNDNSSEGNNHVNKNDNNGRELEGEKSNESENNSEGDGKSEESEEESEGSEEEFNEDQGKGDGEDEGGYGGVGAYKHKNIAFGYEEEEVSLYDKTLFDRILEMFAEDMEKVEVMLSDESKLSMKRLMRRPIERKPLKEYYRFYRKEKVVLLLDNSGSMAPYADFVNTLASIAMARDDVEIYWAPNGLIEAMLLKDGSEILVNHEKMMKMLRGRKIIYVGDYDGANTPIELSWYNTVIWIVTEYRYEDFFEHDWVSYEEDDFKGTFIRLREREFRREILPRLLSVVSRRAYREWIDEWDGS